MFFNDTQLPTSNQGYNLKRQENNYNKLKLSLEEEKNMELCQRKKDGTITYLASHK